MDIKGALGRIAEGHDLTGEDMRAVMRQIMSGEATQAQIGAFLMGMAIKGETVGEIAAAVSILKEKMVPVTISEDAIDIVGTGGDRAGTLNISTASSLVVASAGVPVAKHGNRALSSKSGASQVLESLGVKLDLTPDQIATCLHEAGICFMFAPAHHPAMKYVGPVRAEMGVRTMFNLLGPQANPANVRHFLFGVYDRDWVEPVAAALLANQVKSAWVVYGDGIDEITLTGPTFVASIADGDLRSFEIIPEDVGFKRVPLDDLKGGDPDFNAAAMRAMFDGAPGPYRDVVCLNAGAAFIVMGKDTDLASGVKRAAAQIDSGAARETLDRLVTISNGMT